MIPAWTLTSSSQQIFSETLSAPMSPGNMIPASRCSWSSGSGRPKVLQGSRALSSAGSERPGQLHLEWDVKDE